jgi:hypothetical protein
VGMEEKESGSIGQECSGYEKSQITKRGRI